MALNSFRMLMFFCIPVCLGSYGNAIDNWVDLGNGLHSSRDSLIEAPDVVIQVDVVNQQTRQKNRWTMPVVKSKYTLAIKGNLYRYSHVDQDKTGDFRGNKVFFADTSKNEIVNGGEELDWSGNVGTVAADFRDTMLQCQSSWLDFLSVDISQAMVNRGVFRPLSEEDVDRLKNQLPQPDLPTTLKIARETKGSTIREEKIGDLDCITVEFGKQLFSVCPKLNYALVRRRAIFPGTDLLKFDLRCEDFFSPGRGLYVPRKFVKDVYAKPGEDPSLHNKIVGTVTYKVDFTVDQTSDEWFNPVFPEGFQIWDFKRKIHYEMTGDNARPFGKAHAEARKILSEIEDDPDAQPLLNRRSRWPMLLLVLLVASALWLMWKRASSQ